MLPRDGDRSSERNWIKTRFLRIMDLKNGFFLLIIYGIKGKRGMVIEEMEDVLWISWRERKDRRKGQW